MNKPEIKLIGNGKYGCIFHPGVSCNKKPAIPDKHVVNKVQVKDYTLVKEINIGNAITQIPKYEYRFAPIKEWCNVNLSTVQDNVIQKCDLGITRENKNNFLSSTITYVGKNTLLSYLEKLLEKTIEKSPKIKSGSTLKRGRINMRKFITKIIEIHIYLLESIQLLQSKNIVHFDLKENNILYDENNDIPIIIDYGLSLLWSDIKTADQYKDSFGFHGYETYRYWGIESVLFMYICDNIVKSKDDKFTALQNNIQIEDIKTLKEKTLKTFINGDDDKRHPRMSESEIKTFETKAVHYINSFSKPNTKWITMWESLKNSQSTWDNYSIAQIFYIIFYKFELLDPELNLNFIKKYINILKTIILCEPCKRVPLAETIKSLKGITKHIEKEDLKDEMRQINKKVNQPNYVNNTKQKVNLFKYNELREEKGKK